MFSLIFLPNVAIIARNWQSLLLYLFFCFFPTSWQTMICFCWKIIARFSQLFYQRLCWESVHFFTKMMAKNTFFVELIRTGFLFRLRISLELVYFYWEYCSGYSIFWKISRWCFNTCFPAVIKNNCYFPWVLTQDLFSIIFSRIFCYLRRLLQQFVCFYRYSFCFSWWNFH